MPLPPLELDRLAHLRDRFLLAGERPGRVADYWRDDADLLHYDAVFAARIGWKWDAVLDEIALRNGGADHFGLVVDFGCGTGVATRQVARRWSVGEAVLLDRSARAAEYAARAVDGSVGRARPVAAAHVLGDCRPDLLLVSHVLDELGEREVALLLELADRSQRVWWVEPGSRAVSRALGALRGRLAAGRSVVAPCTHEAACPALADGEAGHWCHFFAAPPPEVFRDADWVRCARAVGIDLRALPYCFLAVQAAPVPAAPAARRLLGRPRVGTKRALFYSCSMDGLVENEVVKSRDRERYRSLKKSPPRWC